MEGFGHEVSPAIEGTANKYNGLGFYSFAGEETTMTNRLESYYSAGEEIAMTNGLESYYFAGEETTLTGGLESYYFAGEETTLTGGLESYYFAGEETAMTGGLESYYFAGEETAMISGPESYYFAGEETAMISGPESYYFASEETTMTNGLESYYFASDQTVTANETANEYNSLEAIPRLGLHSMATITSTAPEESYYGRVASFDDAILLVEASQQGLIPRYSKLEEIMPRAGSIYIYKAKQFKDGKKWKRGTSGKDFQVLTEQVPPQVCGLTKSIFYIAISDRPDLRLVSYSTPDSRGILKRPSENFGSIKIPEDTYTRHEHGVTESELRAEEALNMPRKQQACNRCQAANVKCGEERPSCRLCLAQKYACVYKMLSLGSYS
jgi:hypothetical protein